MFGPKSPSVGVAATPEELESVDASASDPSAANSSAGVLFFLFDRQPKAVLSESR